METEIIHITTNLLSLHDLISKKISDMVQAMAKTENIKYPLASNAKEV